MNRTKITVLIVLGMGIVLLMSYIYLTSDFNMVSSSGMQRDFFVPGEVYHFGHDIEWDGLVSSTINTISLVRKDGTKIKENEQEFVITPFIDYARHTGSLTEKGYQEMASRNELDYEAVGGNKITNDGFTLVFRVKAKDTRIDYGIEGIVIYYRVLGLPKKQFFEYKGFLSD